MRALPLLVLLGATLGCGVAAAGGGAPGATVAPDKPEQIHVNAIRDPEVRNYAAIVAGIDAFEHDRHMAPRVDVLLFRVERRRAAEGGPAPLARLAGDDGFMLPLALDAAGDIAMPRSQPALDARSELTLDQKRRDYRVEPRVRTPGLPDNVRRLGDLRLECKVRVAIAKKEIGLMWTLAINSLLLTSDWCDFMKDKEAGFSFSTPLAITGAVLQEGNRSRNVPFSKNRYTVQLYDSSWSDDALVELTFGEPDAAPPALTGTAGETPRTGS